MGGEIELTVNNLKNFGAVSLAKVSWAISEALLLADWVEGAPRLPNGLC